MSCPHLSSFSETLYHFLEAYAILALGTRWNELYELLARCIEMTSPKLLLGCNKCFCIIEMNEILIVIDIISEVRECPETASIAML
jgi:hypothetical protein